MMIVNVENSSCFKFLCKLKRTAFKRNDCIKISYFILLFIYIYIYNFFFLCYVLSYCTFLDVSVVPPSLSFIFFVDVCFIFVFKDNKELITNAFI